MREFLKFFASLLVKIRILSTGSVFALISGFLPHFWPKVKFLVQAQYLREFLVVFLPHFWSKVKFLVVQAQYLREFLVVFSSLLVKSKVLSTGSVVAEFLDYCPTFDQEISRLNNGAKTCNALTQAMSGVLT